MPRFCRFLSGPRVTVRPQVMSGATSPAHLAQAARPVARVRAHALRDAAGRAEQIAEHRDRATRGRAEGALRPLEQDRRPARLEHAVADLGHLEARVDLGAHALQFPVRLELREEVAQVAIRHAQRPGLAAPSIGTIAPVT
jgi:hypothetical protein